MNVNERETKTEYMRRYRAAKGGASDADRANARAANKAATWVRHHRPELWRELLDEAWRYIRP